MLEQAILLVVIGFVIGIFGGLLGIGGGTVIVPVLRLGFALEAVCATATSLFTIIFTSIGGTITHLRNKTCVPQLSVCLGIGGAITSALGAYLGNISPGWAVMLVAALIIFYSAYTMLKKALRLRSSGASSGPSSEPRRTSGVLGPSSGSSGAPENLNGGGNAEGSAELSTSPAPAPIEEPTAYEFNLKRGLGGFGIGLIAGLASGYVGVGGGFIMVPLMTAWLAVPMRKASGTSLIAIMILAIPGVMTQMSLGNVDYVAGICLAIGSIPGAMVGARFVKSIPERRLRFIFAGFLAVAGILLVLNEAGVLG